jgi:hypothetical protein
MNRRIQKKQTKPHIPVGSNTNIACLPIIGPTMFPELAFPDNMEVFVGPYPGYFGKVDWSANPILSTPTKYHSGTDMMRDYAPCVPIRARGLIARVTWHDVRWVIPHNNQHRSDPSLS